MFRKRLNELFIEGGYTSVVAFADKIGITRQALANYLNGDRLPDFPTLVKICQSLQISADWLLGFSDVRSSSSDIKIACETLHITEDTAKSIIHLQELVDSLAPVDYLFELGEDLETPFAYLAQYHMIRDMQPKGITGIPKTPIIDLDGSVSLSPDNAARYFIQEFCSTLQSLLSYELLKEAINIEDIERNDE